MRRSTIQLIFAVLVLPIAATPGLAAPKLVYDKKSTRAETVLASLKASGLPTLQGVWYVIGPFDNPNGLGFDQVYPPEKEVDLKKTYTGKSGRIVAWKELSNFAVGKVVDLRRYPENDHACVYLFHEIEAGEAAVLPLSLGSDDTLTVWLNGERLLAQNVQRPAAPDQDRAVLKLRAGKNRLLVKVCNGAGDWAFYVRPEFPTELEAKFRLRLDRDFPPSQPLGSVPHLTSEARHYRIDTLPVPPDAVLEVGGLAQMPGGQLLACTRRGDVWMVHHPNADDLSQIKFTRFATGLHEALGLWVESQKVVYVVQRPELTRLVDRDGDGTVDDYQTVCDKWGVSGDYHEFAFGPARDKQGNFYVTLNVGFGGGHQAKAPWRGWCVKITPAGELVPFATGLRSPNGLNFNPDDDLFYCDNQGEWVASNKMHHVREGDFFGHPAGLRWVKSSPFAGKIPESNPSGMLYDGQKGQGGVEGKPRLSPPCIWFPYGRMGQSASEPIWDTMGGRFGPFAGQCLVGDQMRACVMRVALEKVNGRYQGACFPFRSGFECGVNRLVFGTDATLYVGMTNRGWGSLGGKPWGLQRLVYTGVLPFEIHTMKLTKSGFDLTFTKPLDSEAAGRPAAFAVQSFTYNYWSTYGSPEVDRRAEKVGGVTLSADHRRVTLALGGLRPGRVYELHLEGVKSADAEPLLHPEAYYTLNELP